LSSHLIVILFDCLPIWLSFHLIVLWSCHSLSTPAFLTKAQLCLWYSLTTEAQRQSYFCRAEGEPGCRPNIAENGFSWYHTSHSSPLMYRNPNAVSMEHQPVSVIDGKDSNDAKRMRSVNSLLPYWYFCSYCLYAYVYNTCIYMYISIYVHTHKTISDTSLLTDYRSRWSWLFQNLFSRNVCFWNIVHLWLWKHAFCIVIDMIGGVLWEFPLTPKQTFLRKQNRSKTSKIVGVIAISNEYTSKVSR